MYPMWLNKWHVDHTRTVKVRQHTYITGATINALIFLVFQWLLCFHLFPGPEENAHFFLDLVCAILPMSILNMFRFMIHAKDWAEYILEDPLSLYPRLNRMVEGQPLFILPPELLEVWRLDQFPIIDMHLVKCMRQDDPLSFGEMHALMSLVWPFRYHLEQFEYFERYCLRMVCYLEEELKTLAA